MTNDSRVRRFNVADTDGEERFELEATFGPDAELVDLTDVLRASIDTDH